MIGAEHLLIDRQRALQKRPRPKVALSFKQQGEVVEADCCVGILGTQRLLADRQRALIERPCRGSVAQVLEQTGEVVEAIRGVGMLGTQRLLADRQRAFKEWSPFRIGGAPEKIAARSV
jgi:hypothetical protein